MKLNSLPLRHKMETPEPIENSKKINFNFNTTGDFEMKVTTFFGLEEVLAAQRLQQKTSAANALHDVAESIHKRSLVIVFSDMFETGNDAENLFKALQHLKHLPLQV